ncbi:MAG: DUF2794 domain-containing protein [Kiloniellales bacterium]|nr:DUF2794 domain-containing protein [Kiloniellales bacterium]
MGKVYRLEDVRRRARPSKHATFFTRYELNQLLSLYSRRVASGEWRDYAIDRQAGMAVFSVFRHTHDRPIFSIAKRINKADAPAEYLVFSGTARLKRAKTIAEALKVFERKLDVVRAGWF